MHAPQIEMVVISVFKAVDDLRTLARPRDRSYNNAKTIHDKSFLSGRVGYEANSYMESRCSKAKNVTQRVISNTSINATAHVS